MDVALRWCGRHCGVAGYGLLVGPAWPVPLALVVIGCTLNPTVRDFGRLVGICLGGVAISAAVDQIVAVAVGIGLVVVGVAGWLFATAVVPTPAKPPVEEPVVDCIPDPLKIIL